MPERIGKYRDIELIGKGATASVYLAQHPDLRQLRAIKVFEAVRTMGSDGLLAEAVHQAGLHNRRILQVYDQEIDPQTGKLFLVMEYAEYGSLRSLLEQGPLERQTALKLAAQAAEGLAAAHAAGLCHLDVKPENILLRGPDDAVIGDFGLAVAPESGPDGHPGGTPNYMPPEQIQGAYGCSCDVWALGAVLYELLSGRLCFEGEDRQSIVQAVLSGPGDIAARLQKTGHPQSARVCNLFHRMLEMDPAGRIDATAAFHELKALAKEDGSGANEQTVCQVIPTEAPQWRCSKCGRIAPWGMDICLDCAQQQASQKAMTVCSSPRPRPNKKAFAVAACAAVLLIGSLAAGAYFLHNEPQKPGALALLVNPLSKPLKLQSNVAEPLLAAPTTQPRHAAAPQNIAAAQSSPAPKRVPANAVLHATGSVPSNRVKVAPPVKTSSIRKTVKAKSIAKATPVNTLRQKTKAKDAAPGNNTLFKAMATSGSHAEGLLRQRLRAQPNHAGASRNLALLLMEQKRYKEALTVLEKIARRHPEDNEASQAAEVAKRLLAVGTL